MRQHCQVTPSSETIRTRVGIRSEAVAPPTGAPPAPAVGKDQNQSGRNNRSPASIPTERPPRCPTTAPIPPRLTSTSRPPESRQPCTAVNGRSGTNRRTGRQRSARHRRSRRSIGIWPRESPMDSRKARLTDGPSRSNGARSDKLHEVGRLRVVAERLELLFRTRQEHALGEHLLDGAQRHVQVLPEAEESRLHLHHLIRHALVSRVRELAKAVNLGDTANLVATN